MVLPQWHLMKVTGMALARRTEGTLAPVVIWKPMEVEMAMLMEVEIPGRPNPRFCKSCRVCARAPTVAATRAMLMEVETGSVVSRTPSAR